MLTAVASAGSTMNHCSVQHDTSTDQLINARLLEPRSLPEISPQVFQQQSANGWTSMTFGESTLNCSHQFKHYMLNRKDKH